jgi:hypothetical protein
VTAETDIMRRRPDRRRAANEEPRPLAGLVVLGGLASGRDRLAQWGARCAGTDDIGALRRLLDAPETKALCWLPDGHLPIRPPQQIASLLLDSADHLGASPEAGWCLTRDTARRALAALPGREDLPGGMHALARDQVGAAAGQPPCHVGRSSLRLPDLPSAFASGRPFAGPFSADEPLVSARALAAASPGRSRPVAPRLPPNLRPVGPPPAPRPGEILALLVARDEALRLPDALAAASALGVDRAIVVDNGSSDGTRDIASAAGAHLISAEEDYAASGFGITWTNAVLDAYARGHWVLVLDADEQLVFPGSDRVGLHALTEHLDALGSEALRTIMLDCFPAGPLATCGYRGGTPLPGTAPMFEPPQLRQERIEDFPYELDYGGIRERLFFPEADPRRPPRWLRQKLFNLGLRVPGLRNRAMFRRLAPPRSPTVTKLPLLRWREGAALLASTHRVAPMAMSPEQPSGVLLHFKFLQDFHARALDAVARGAHWDGSREYRRYLARIEADPGFALSGPRARAYAGPDQLVALGLMRDTPAWREARGGA